MGNNEKQNFKDFKYGDSRVLSSINDLEKRISALEEKLLLLEDCKDLFQEIKKDFDSLEAVVKRRPNTGMFTPNQRMSVPNKAVPSKVAMLSKATMLDKKETTSLEKSYHKSNSNQKQIIDKETIIGKEQITRQETISNQEPIIDRMKTRLWNTDIPGAPVTDIRSAISMNDRIFFINDLYEEDSNSYNADIVAFNSMKSFNEAIDYITSKHPNWDLDSESVYRFIMAIRRRLQ